MWQPIESAPKDGTTVLLFFPSGATDEDRYKIGFWSSEAADWFGSEAASHSLTEFGDQPSHWSMLSRPLSTDAA